MPNRILKESIKSSEQIDALSWFEEVLYYRLLVSADDYGCMDGRTILLRNELFPLKESVTKKAVDDAIAHLASVGLLRRYEVSGKPYLLFPTWEKHQRVRNKHRKYPQPLDSELLSNDGQMTASCPPESESNPNPIRIRIQDSAEPATVSAPPVIALPLNDGSEFEVSAEDVLGWEQLYPAVDVHQQLRNMKGWLVANPKKRKTNRGILAFITSWLAREQDRGGVKTAAPKARKNVFVDMAREVSKIDNG